MQWGETWNLYLVMIVSRSIARSNYNYNTLTNSAENPTKLYKERLLPVKSKPLPFYKLFFDRKRLSPRIPSIKKWYPFQTHKSLKQKVFLTCHSHKSTLSISSFWQFSRPKWQIIRTLNFNTLSQKNIPVSGGAYPSRPLQGVHFLCPPPSPPPETGTSVS